MKVTRNMDDDKNQDPFFTMYYFRLDQKKYMAKKERKYSHDLVSPSIDEQKSKVIKNGGKEVDFNEYMSIGISMTFQDKIECEHIEPLGNDVIFLVIHFKDKDFFSFDTIGRTMIDISNLVLDENEHLDVKVKKQWFPIIYSDK